MVSRLEGLEGLDVERSMKATVAALNEALASVEMDPRGQKALLDVIERKLSEAEGYYCRPVDDPTIYERLARVYEAHGDREKAKAASRKVAIKQAEALEFQARQMAFFGATRRALALYERALSLDPANELASKGASKARKAVDRAERDLPRSRAKAENEGGAREWTMLATTLLALDDVDGAEKAADRALAVDGRDMDALCRMGNVLGVRGLWKEAIPYFERALEVSSASKKAKQGLNYAKYNLGTLD